MIHELTTILDHPFVVPEPMSGCWLWSGALMPNGYGKVGYKSRHWLVHRLSWLLSHGHIDDDLMVLHKCNNRCCCNPDHLHQGTAKENTAYAILCNRLARGERAGPSKLTDDQVREIRRLYDSGTTMYRIAKNIGMCDETIRKIVHRKTWVHV